MELQNLFRLTFSKWCVCWGRREDFTIVRGIVEKLGSSSLTSNIKDFDRFIRES